MKRIIIILLILILNQIYSYSTPSPRWEKMPITIFVSENNPRVSQVKLAFSTWQQKSMGLVRFVYLDDKKINDANIIVFFVDKTRKSDESKKTLGWSHCKWHNGFYTQCRIEIANRYPDNNKPLTETETYNITLHEIGHSLGLSHSVEKSDIMYDTLNFTQNGISKNDLTRLINIYKK